MTYIERTIGNKVIYGWGKVRVPRGYELFAHLYKKVDWSIGPFSKELK